VDRAKGSLAPWPGCARGLVFREGKLSLIIGLSAAAACQAAPWKRTRSSCRATLFQSSRWRRHPTLSPPLPAERPQPRSLTYWIAPSGTTLGEDDARPDPRISLSPRQPGKLLSPPTRRRPTAPALQVARSPQPTARSLAARRLSKLQSTASPVPAPWMRADRRAFSTGLRLKSSRRTGTRVRFHRAEPPLVRGSEPTSKFLHALSPHPKSHAVIFSALFWSRFKHTRRCNPSSAHILVAELAWPVTVTSPSPARFCRHLTTLHPSFSSPDQHGVFPIPFALLSVREDCGLCPAENAPLGHADRLSEPLHSLVPPSRFITPPRPRAVSGSL